VIDFIALSTLFLFLLDVGRPTFGMEFLDGMYHERTSPGAHWYLSSISAATMHTVPHQTHVIYHLSGFTLETDFCVSAQRSRVNVEFRLVADQMTA
jgi:hypothetical protein